MRYQHRAARCNANCDVFEFKKNDEVIVPNITWVATAKAVIYAGAKPVFADINEDDWTINPESIIKLINKNTKAIMPVHLYGQPSKMDLIMRIAKKIIVVIEDAAPAIGAEFKGKNAVRLVTLVRSVFKVQNS